MQIKKKQIYSHKCDYCNRELILNGKDSDSYVVTAEYRYFCIIQTPGKPAERDCMKNYLENKKKKNEYTFKKRLEEKEEQEEKKEEQKEKRLEARPRVLAKLAELNKFLKEKQFKNRIKDNQRFGTLPTKNLT
jgi:hypothetical protein